MFFTSSFSSVTVTFAVILSFTPAIDPSTTKVPFFSYLLFSIFFGQIVFNFCILPSEKITFTEAGRAGLFPLLVFTLICSIFFIEAALCSANTVISNVIIFFSLPEVTTASKVPTAFSAPIFGLVTFAVLSFIRTASLLLLHSILEPQSPSAGSGISDVTFDKSLKNLLIFFTS